MSPDLKGLKVLHLIDSGGLYGAEKMLLSLVKEQISKGLKPMILSAGEPDTDEKPLEREARRLQLPITIWRMKPGLNLREARKICCWAATQGFLLLHSHGYKFNILMGILRGVMRDVRFVVTKHGYVHAPFPSRTLAYQWLDKFATISADHRVLVGSRMIVSRGSFSPPTTVIHNGLDVDSVLRDSETQLQADDIKVLSNHHPVMMGVGRLATEKGFDKIIKAMPLIREKQNRAALVLIGEGYQKDALVKLAQELGVSDCVYFMGYRSDVAAWLRSADMLLMPSLTEGLPISLLESMILQTPIIATQVGDIPEVLGGGHGGRLLKDTTAFELFSQVEKVCEGGAEIMEMIRWSFERVKRDFSVSVMEQKYRSVYLKALS